jgi:hypothetical protein
MVSNICLDFFVRNSLQRFRAVMCTRFYKPAVQPTENNTKKNNAPRPKLSKEAQAALSARRCAASEKYHDALQKIWSKLDEETTSIAVEHSKSLRKVQMDLQMGRQLSLKRHSKVSAWNTFCWKKHQEEKENQVPASKTLYISLFRIFL